MQRLTQLPDEPILIATFADDLDQLQLDAVLKESDALLPTMDPVCCLILDVMAVKSIQIPLEVWAEKLVAWLAQWQNHMIILAAVGIHPELKELAHLFKSKHQLPLPLFDEMEPAQSYLNLKIASINIRQSRDSATTFFVTAEERKKLMNLVQAELPQKLDENTQSFFPEGSILRLESAQLEKTMLIFPDKGVILGRRDSKGYKPDVDMSLWAGYSSGVSRQHAKLYIQDARLYIMDLGSTNGTFVNSEQLMPNRKRPLRDGDELQVGKLSMFVRFQTSVKKEG